MVGTDLALMIADMKRISQGFWQVEITKLLEMLTVYGRMVLDELAAPKSPAHIIV